MDWYDNKKNESINKKSSDSLKKDWYGDLKKSNDNYNKEEIEILDPLNTPSISTIMKAGWSRDPETKKDIYSEATGIPKENYSYEDGLLVHTDKEGKKRRATKSGFLSWLKRTGIETVTDPAVIGSTALGALGAATGGIGIIPGAVVGSVLGGSGGEYARQDIASNVLNEEMTPKERAYGVGVEGALGLGSELVTKGITTTARALKKPTSKAFQYIASKTDNALKNKLVNIYGDEVTADYIINIQNNSQKFGIPLNLAQITADGNLISMLNTLRRNPDAINKIQQSDAVTKQQIKDNLPIFIKDLFGESIGDSLDVGRATKKAAEDATKGLTKLRTKIAQPLYEIAFKEKPVINTEESIRFINEQLEFATDKTSKELKKIKNNLVTITPKVKDTPSKTYTEIPSRKIVNLITELNDRINFVYKGKEVTSSEKTVARYLSKVKESLENLLDNSSPKFRRARMIYSLLSNPKKTTSGKNITESQGLLTLIKNTSEKDLINLSNFIITSKYSNPTTIFNVKKQILEQENGKQIWNNVISDYLTNVLKSQKDTVSGNTGNLGGNMRKAVFGSELERDKWKKILNPEQYKTFEAFLDVLRRTSLTAPFGSDTAANQAINKEISETFSQPFFRAAAHPMMSTEHVLFSKFNDLYKGNATKEMTDIILSKDSLKTLQKLKKVKDKGKLIEGFSRLLGWSFVSDIQREIND